MKKERYDLVVICDLPVLRQWEMRIGPFIPLSVVHRLVRRSRTRVYQLARGGKLRVFSVMGLLMTPTKDVEKQWPI
jgi:hypothetical protein